MSEKELELRVGTLTDRHAFVRVFDATGYAGEALLDRSTIDAIANGAGIRTGDWLTVEVRLRRRSHAHGRPQT